MAEGVAEKIFSSLDKHNQEKRDIILSHCDDMYFADKVKIMMALKDIHTDTRSCIDTILEVVKRARLDTVDYILPEKKVTK